MKKLGTYFLVFILSIIIFLFGFQFDSKREPNIYYKVYLEDELIGTIKSREELEDYINNQANVIRENIREYSKKIDAYDTYQELVKKNNLTNSSSVVNAQELLNNQKGYNLSNLDMENLNYYLANEIYNLSTYSIKEMHEYVDANQIYMKVNQVYTPNGIDIKKVYTYENSAETVSEIYKRIISKESCSIAGYKFTIKSNKENVKDIVVYTLDKETMVLDTPPLSVRKNIKVIHKMR